jgi:hypothetical protein
VNHRGIRHNRLSGDIEAQGIRSKRYNSTTASSMTVKAELDVATALTMIIYYL